MLSSINSPLLTALPRAGTQDVYVVVGTVAAVTPCWQRMDWSLFWKRTLRGMSNSPIFILTTPSYRRQSSVLVTEVTKSMCSDLYSLCDYSFLFDLFAWVVAWVGLSHFITCLITHWYYCSIIYNYYHYYYHYIDII